MPGLPIPRNPAPFVERRIHKAVSELDRKKRAERASTKGPRLYVSQIGRCPRNLWAGLRGIAEDSEIEPRMLVLFDLGDAIEAHVIGLLRHAGFRVFDRDPVTKSQWRVSDFRDRLSGRLDGKIELGEDRWSRYHALLEIKSANERQLLLAQEQGTASTTTWTNYVRAGLVWDTRDRETGPRRGTWTEFLVQRIDESLGADVGYTRWTFTDRRYFSLTDRLVFAHRYLIQGVSEGAPAFELFQVQTSFSQQEGLGGAKTVRGIFKNRFVGRGMLVWNAELRLRAAEFSVGSWSFEIVLSAFLDQGRVWDAGVQLDEVLTDLHRGFGGGVRIGAGQNFVVAVDMGRSEEAGMPLYIGLGYLY